MFVVILERVVGHAKAVGPFEHQEDAEAWAEENGRLHVWRVTKLLSPQEGESK